MVGLLAMALPTTVWSSSALAAVPTIGVVASEVTVRPTIAVTGMTAGATLTAARNEFESFQVVVQAGATPVTNLQVSLTPQPGDDIAAANVTIYEQRYYDVVNPSMKDPVPGTVGRWADPLVPKTDTIFGQARTALAGVTVPANENRAAWIDVFVPPSTSPGVHRTTLTVTATGVSQQIPVTVTALDFIMPSTPTLTSDFPADFNQMCRAHFGGLKCNVTTSAHWRTSSLYARIALENRVPLSTPFLGEDRAAPSTVASDPVRQGFDTYALPFIKGTRPVIAGTLPPRLTGARETVVSRNAADTTLGYYCNATCLSSWHEESVRNGFEDRLLLYGCDEPHSATKFLDCDKVSGLYPGVPTPPAGSRTGWPDAPRATTTTIAEVQAYDTADPAPVCAGDPTSGWDVLVPNVTYNPDRSQYASWLGSTPCGHPTNPANRFWAYTACDSFSCGTNGAPDSVSFVGFPGYAIDAPSATQARALPWMAWTHGATGELYYEAMKSMPSAWTNQYTFAVQGDGNLFYPGLSTTNPTCVATPGNPACIGGTEDIPIESIRLKRMRDGREDYEYLTHLAANGKATQAKAIVDALFPTWHGATKATEQQLGGARAQLIALINGLTPIPPPSAPGNVVATAGVASATVTWTAATSDPARPVLDYTITATPAVAGIPVVTAPATSTVVTGLTPGVSYTFKVTARNASGSGPPSAASNAVTPTALPAGRIAFSRSGPDCAGGRCIWTMKPDGSDPVQLTNPAAGVQDRFPAWSPDGSQIAFSRRNGADSDLLLVDYATGATTTLTSGAAIDEKPAFSPDGNAIAFVRSTGGTTGMDIFRLNRVAGSFGTPVPVVVQNGNDFDPDWAVDGATIVFSAAFNLKRVNADGSNLQAVTSGAPATQDDNPASSPTGTRIAFDRTTSAAPGTYDIVAANPNGTASTNLTPGTAGSNEVSPAWSPDGSVVVFVTDAAGGHRLARVPATGGASVMITGADHDDRDPAWVASAAKRREGGWFHPMAPVRILDSRTGPGWTGRLVAGTPRELKVTGTDIPEEWATSVVLNVTVTGSTAPSFLTVFPGGGSVPNASNLNFAAGQTVPNLVTAGIGPNGAVSFATAVGSVDVVADIVGWYDNGFFGVGDRFAGIAPARLLDSRLASSTWHSPLPAGAANARTVQITGGTVPGAATAAVLNVTTTESTANSFLQVWPTGTARPNTSNLNFAAGQTTSNLVTTQLGTGGTVSVYNNVGSTHVIVDVVGYYGGDANDTFHRLATPVRLLDDRTGNGAIGPWGPNQTRSVKIAGRGTVANDATAVVVNMTATNGTAGSFLSVFPDLGPVPGSSTLNFGPGQTVPNLAMTALGANGRLAVRNHLGAVDVVGDVTGYFAPY